MNFRTLFSLLAGLSPLESPPRIPVHLPKPPRSFIPHPAVVAGRSRIEASHSETPQPTPILQDEYETCFLVLLRSWRVAKRNTDEIEQYLVCGLPLKSPGYSLEKHFSSMILYVGRSETLGHSVWSQSFFYSVSLCFSFWFSLSTQAAFFCCLASFPILFLFWITLEFSAVPLNLA